MTYKTSNNFLTVGEVSRILKLSVLTIYKYIREQQLEAVAFGGHYRIDKSSLNDFIERNKVSNKIKNGQL